MSVEMDRPLKRSLWRRGLAIGGPTVALIAILIACAVMVSSAQATLAMPRASVSVGKAQTGVFQDFSPIQATVVARDVISLDAGEGGRVKDILARSGDLVRAGQPLVRFDNPDLEMQVLERQSRQIATISGLQSELNGLEDARASNAMNMASLEFELAKLQAEYQRKQALYDKGFGSTVDRDNARSALDLKLAMKPLQTEIVTRAEAQRQRRQPEIRAEIEEARQALAAIRASMSGLAVKAPADGRLSEFVMTIGETKGRAEIVGKLTLHTGFKLTAPIDPFYLGRVRVGQSAEVTLPLLDEVKILPARVSRVDPQVKDGTFQVELEFTSRLPVDLLEGQTLDGRVMLGDDRRALVIPAGAWLDATGGAWVMVMDADGRSATRRTVKIGKRSEAQVEVLSGLKPGETVITSTHQGLDKVHRIEFSN